MKMKLLKIQMPRVTGSKFDQSAGFHNCHREMELKPMRVSPNRGGTLKAATVPGLPLATTKGIHPF